MTNLNQLIINFDYEQNFKDDDFYVSDSNKHVFTLINKWPKWEKNFLNINGEKFSGKTHLIKIFLKNLMVLNLMESLTDDDLKIIKVHQNIILENLDEKINEKLLYSLLNIIDLENKFIIVTSEKPLVDIDFSLIDLKSRTKIF